VAALPGSRGLPLASAVDTVGDEQHSNLSFADPETWFVPFPPGLNFSQAPLGERWSGSEISFVTDPAVRNSG
jgi:hypothetical protein